MTKEERIWSAVVLALVRDRNLTDWTRIGAFLVKALEKVARQKDSAEAEELEPVLMEARYSLTSKAEIELRNSPKPSRPRPASPITRRTRRCCCTTRNSTTATFKSAPRRHVEPALREPCQRQG